jgi:hypothetical protein
VPNDHHYHHLLLSAGDGRLLRRGGLRPGRHAWLRSRFGALSAGHDLYDDGDELRLHRRYDPLRRPQAERPDVQLLQVGYLPAGDDMRRRPEERRMRLRLRLPVIHRPSLAPALAVRLREGTV